MSSCFPPRLCTLALALVLGAAACLAAPARAGWSADPVEVFGTPNLCPQVAACSDAAHGAIVVWQENTPTGSVLRAQHVLATGDVDPAWPAPATVTATSAARPVVGAVSDGLGGAYVWWMVNAYFSVTRIGPDGALAAGWPANGRVLGTLFTGALRPTVVADGAHGFYAAWPQRDYSSTPWRIPLYLAHVGPSNTAAGGFPPAAVRVIGDDPDNIKWTSTSGLGVVPDGGVWLAWGTTTVTDTSLTNGEYRLTRLDSAGLPLAGWDALGTPFDVFPSAQLNSTVGWTVYPAMSLASVADDGSGGAFVEIGRANPDAPNGALEMLPQLHHFGADALPAPGWPVGGVAVYTGGLPASFDNGASASFRVLSDLHGGVFAGVPSYASEATEAYTIDHYSAAGATLPEMVGANQLGLDVAQRPDGAVFVASFNPSGPTSSWSPNAYVGVASTAGASWGEVHATPVVTWYGDVAVASTGDDGAILVWSQTNERFGIYAVRVNGSGLVTGVPGTLATGPARLALRFVPGQGVRAYATLAGGAARCRLADVAGRGVAHADFQARAGVSEWTLPGTAALAPGVYMARVDVAGRTLTAKVVVTR